MIVEETPTPVISIGLQAAIDLLESEELECMADARRAVMPPAAAEGLAHRAYHMHVAARFLRRKKAEIEG